MEMLSPGQIAAVLAAFSAVIFVAHLVDWYRGIRGGEIPE